MSAERSARAEPPIRSWLRVVWLVALVYAVASATKPGFSGWHIITLGFTAVITIGWGLWLASRHWRNDRLSAVGIVLLAISGGALTPLSHFGIVVVGIAGMCAASLFELVLATILTASSVAAAAIAYGLWSDMTQATSITNAASGALAGLVIGLGRRQQYERTVAQHRTELEHERAEMFGERNRIAREVHDVLAHTLSALSVQMEALDSLVADGADRAELQGAVQRSRRLVVSGLQETRHAVQALRDEPIAITDQVSAATAESGASFEVIGSPIPLTPAQGLTLLRVAQEALTNARKHAPGAPVSVRLEFLPGAVKLSVVNTRTDTKPAPISTTGGGYGLRGMSERMELLGGTVTAGAYDGGWRVQAELPT